MLGPLALLVALMTSFSTAIGEGATLGHKAAARDSDWVAEACDNICGLSDLRALSDPAKVDYGQLWDATPEVKKMKRDGIDPGSAEGISLQQKATDRIREACNTVREDEGLCSVWKKIRHKDGRKVEDITKKVEKKFPLNWGS